MLFQASLSDQNVKVPYKNVPYNADKHGEFAVIHICAGLCRK